MDDNKNGKHRNSLRLSGKRITGQEARPHNMCIAKMQADGSRVSTFVTLFSHISSLTFSI